MRSGWEVEGSLRKGRDNNIIHNISLKGAISLLGGGGGESKV